MYSQTAIYIFVDCPIAIADIILVSLSILILSRLKENSIFAYFKFECTFVLFDCFINALLPIYKCVSWCFSSLLVCLLDQFGFNFLASVFETSSLLLANFVAINCLFQFYSINSSNQFVLIWSKLLKINPYIIAFVIFAFSFVVFSYEIFIYRIETVLTPDTNASYWYCYWVDDGKSPPFNVLIILSFAFSYGVLAFILTIINFLIVFKIRSSLTNESVLGPNITAKRRVAEKKLTRLILTDCFIIIASRLPIFIGFVLMSTIDYSDFPLLGLSNTFLLISYFLKFFIFYNFNNKFKCETKKLFSKMNCFK